MLALFTVLIIISLSLLVSRIATMALTLTGMSQEAARFQSRSALTGVGFTTTEAEAIVTHPVRRRIVMILMLVGGAGIVTTLATLMLSFSGADRGQGFLRLAVLVAGLMAILWISRRPSVDRLLSRLIARGLERWTDLDARDYNALLHLSGDFAVLEIGVQPEDWVAGRTLGDLDLRGEGIAVLGIERPDGTYLGAPVRETPVRPGDTVIAYGPSKLLCELDSRPRGPEGDAAHERAVADQRRRLEEDAAVAERR